MTDLAMLLKRNSIEVFAQRDSQARLCALRTIWSRTARFRTVEGTFTGHLAISDHIGRLLHRYPEFDFAPKGETNEIDDAAAINWVFGSFGLQPGFSGTDVIVVEHSLISSVCRFSDGPSW